MSDEENHDRALLDEYGRTQPVIQGDREILPLALKGDRHTTTYGLNTAREQRQRLPRIEDLMGLSGTAKAGMFQYVDGTEDDDYISVQPFNGQNVYGEIQTIAKAIGLGRFEYDGVVFTNDEDGTQWLAAYVSKNKRTLTSLADDTVITEYITPGYSAGDRILALSSIQGFDPVFEGNGDDVAIVEWLEVSPARSWAQAANS